MSTVKKSRNLHISLCGTIAVLLAVLFIIPFYLLFINSVKSFKDIMLNTAAFPTTIVWSNYTEAWEVLDYPRSFTNSLVINILSNIGVLVIIIEHVNNSPCTKI